MVATYRDSDSEVLASVVVSTVSDTEILAPEASIISDSEVSAIVSVAVDCDSEIETESFASYWSYVQQAAATWGSQCKNHVPKPELSLYLGDLELTPLVKTLEISRPFNGKTQCSFVLNLPTNEYRQAILPSDICPPGFGDYEGKVKRHNGTLDTILDLKIAVAGQEWKAPELLPGLPNFTGTELKWSGDDVSALLEAPSAAGDMEDIILEAGDYVSFSAAMKECGDYRGIKIIPEFKGFPDSLVNELRRNSGSPQQWIDQVAKIYQAGRRAVRGGIKYEVHPNTLRSPRWKFIDRQNIQTLSAEQLTPPPNQFTCVRTQTTAGVVGEKECNNRSCIGRQPLDLEMPSKFVQIIPEKVANGGLVDFVFWDQKDGTVLSGPNSGTYAGPVPCKYVEFTYRPNIGNFEYTPYYQIYARGGGNAPIPQAPFEFVKNDAAAQEANGVIPEYTNLDNPVIADAATAEACCQATLDASVLRHWSCKFGTPYLNPEIEPGDVIEVTDFLTRQNATLWFVELVKFKFDGRFWSMELDCVRPA